MLERGGPLAEKGVNAGYSPLHLRAFNSQFRHPGLSGEFRQIQNKGPPCWVHPDLSTLSALIYLLTCSVGPPHRHLPLPWEITIQNAPPQFKGRGCQPPPSPILAVVRTVWLFGMSLPLLVAPLGTLVDSDNRWVLPSGMEPPHQQGEHNGGAVAGGGAGLNRFVLPSASPLRLKPPQKVSDTRIG